jgi:hypothetical protein
MSNQDQKLFYIESRAYHCTIIKASSEDSARKLTEFPCWWQVPGDSTRLVREATPEDIEEFKRSGGTIR